MRRLLLTDSEAASCPFPLVMLHVTWMSCFLSIDGTVIRLGHHLQLLYINRGSLSRNCSMLLVLNGWPCVNHITLNERGHLLKTKNSVITTCFYSRSESLCQLINEPLAKQISVNCEKSQFPRDLLLVLSECLNPKHSFWRQFKKSIRSHKL